MSDFRFDDHVRDALVRLLLSIADDKYFLGHRNGDWTGLAPFLEEDIAFSNIAQDEIAHAQELYKLVAALIAPQADATAEANRLAYARPADQRYNAVLVERADDFDWAAAITRQFLYDHFDQLRLPRLARSCWPPLAQLAEKMVQEIGFHVEHFDNWMAQLATGGAQSKQRLQSAVNVLFPDGLGLFEAVQGQEQLIAAGLYPGSDEEMCEQWIQRVTELISSVGIQVPAATKVADSGGRAGRHTEELPALLEELAEVYTLEPDARW